MTVLSSFFRVENFCIEPNEQLLGFLLSVRLKINFLISHLKHIEKQWDTPKQMLKLMDKKIFTIFFVYHDLWNGPNKSKICLDLISAHQVQNLCYIYTPHFHWWGWGHIVSPLSIHPDPPIFFFSYNGPGWGHLCHIDTFLLMWCNFIIHGWKFSGLILNSGFWRLSASKCWIIRRL